MSDELVFPSPLDWSSSLDVVSSLVIKMNELIRYLSLSGQNVASEGQPSSDTEDKVAGLESTVGKLYHMMTQQSERIAKLESK